MDARSDATLIGVGLYTVPQAARLAHVPARSIRRWLFGYTYRYEGENVASPAVVHADFAEIVRKHRIVTFRDLIEIQFVHAFRSAGASWTTIRKAAASASEITGSHHPFATRRFVTDGETIFEDFAPAALLDLVKKPGQLAARDILLPSLRAKLDVSSEGARRWWPLGKNRPVVIDPERQFGQPISRDEGVPTVVLARAATAMKSVDRASKWFDVSRAAVRAAVEFEQRLAA
jgi:uncharacterized protein (DUF433 family)